MTKRRASVIIYIYYIYTAYIYRTGGRSETRAPHERATNARRIKGMACAKVKECMCPKVSCPNHGTCCDCVKKHRETDSLPYCLFPDNGGDKSNENHYRVLKKRFESEVK